VATSRARRRSFLGLLASGGLGAIAAGCDRTRVTAGTDAAGSPYDGKIADMMLHTERPPNLETPARFLAYDLTPNDAMFVRWHLSVVPTSVDERAHRLRVGGHVERPVELSLDHLRARFETTSVVAVNQCSGNGRALFSPRVPGVQWTRGAIGNARWTGVRLKDVLAAASPRAGAVELRLGGLDRAPLDSVPDFEKSLPMPIATGSDVLVAWAMNDAPLPMMNGYPLRLVVPGWYSTYWVKALDRIDVLDHEFDGFWMKKAYRIPANADADERPDDLSKETIPIHRMNVGSLFVRPQPGERLALGAPCEVEGVAWDSGSGVARVEVSSDGGGTWQDARLDGDLGPYSWRRWRSSWVPSQKGPATVTARATSVRGEVQGARSRWNRSGYMKNDCELIDVEVA
jgi:sulfite dehydrogenase